MLRNGVSSPSSQSSPASPANWLPGESSDSVSEPLNTSAGDDLMDVDGFFAEVRRRILESWWGAIPVEADEMQKHLERSVAPVYPEVARHAVWGDAGTKRPSYHSRPFHLSNTIRVAIPAKNGIPK